MQASNNNLLKYFQQYNLYKECPLCKTKGAIGIMELKNSTLIFFECDICKSIFAHQNTTFDLSSLSRPMKRRGPRIRVIYNDSVYFSLVRIGEKGVKKYVGLSIYVGEEIAGILEYKENVRCEILFLSHNKIMLRQTDVQNGGYKGVKDKRFGYFTFRARFASLKINSGNFKIDNLSHRGQKVGHHIAFDDNGKKVLIINIALFVKDAAIDNIPSLL